MVFGLAAAALALGGCGVSVAAGGHNAATHPASGIWVSPTVGGGPISGEADGQRSLPATPEHAPGGAAGGAHVHRHGHPARR